MQSERAANSNVNRNYDGIEETQPEESFPRKKDSQLEDSFHTNEEALMENSLRVEESYNIDESVAGSANDEPAEWDGVNPNAVLNRSKLIKPELLLSLSLKPFYRSYSSWSKMTMDQKTKQ